VQSQSGRDLEGRAAVVTGGSRGIGLAIARALLERGARVVITGRKPETLAEARRSLEAGGFEHVRDASAHSADPGAVARVFDEAERAFGTVRIVVNNAATNVSMAPLAEIDLAAFDKVMDTNVRGYLIVAREAIRRLRAVGGGGSIIQVSSMAAQRAWPGLAAYGVSKAAVNAMTRTLAVECGKDGIRVNSIAPGVVRTRFSEALWKGPGAEAGIASKVPLGRIAEPEDVAGMAAFLASDAASYVTGQTLLVDGGWSVT